MTKTVIIPSNKHSLPLGKKIKEFFYHFFKLSSRPTIKVYNGYGGNGELNVFGHVFAVSPLPRKKYRKNFITNTFALIRLFMVKPVENAKVTLEFQGRTIEAVSAKDGFFRLQWRQEVMPSAGWHKVEVVLSEGVVKYYYGKIKSEAELYIPHKSQYSVISDIDDTFLISHSVNLRKRLFVLLTENAYTRQPFEGVVKHYQALSYAGSAIEPNPFFYVSSSEWNLYDYINDFSSKNELPKGIYLLNQLKKISQVWKTGQNNHGTKFMRIARILEAFPEQQFILLGDDSQQDPFIYQSVVEHFPGQIVSVYLRNIVDERKELVKEAIARIKEKNVKVCHFKHSRDAIDHSIQIGLI